MPLHLLLGRQGIKYKAKAPASSAGPAFFIFTLVFRAESGYNRSEITAAAGLGENNSMIFENMDRIVFAGDSVTDMGSVQPVGEGLFDNMGHGYPRVIESLACAVYPELSLRFTNSGIGGNTSRMLLERYKRDVLDLHPQWVSICIGINDVWRQFDSPAIPDEAVSPEEYERNLRSMIESAAAVAKGVILATPYYMEPNRTDFMRARMQEYIDICAKLAREYKCIFVDFQSMYDRYFAYKHSSLIAWDRVHPNQIGATLMAKEWLAACGFDYNHVPGNG